jgi:DNA phosphorothioation-dependent restriction protein DptG
MISFMLSVAYKPFMLSVFKMNVTMLSVVALKICLVLVPLTEFYPLLYSKGSFH